MYDPKSSYSRRGFELFTSEGVVRRITEQITAVKNDTGGYYLAEFKDANWHCDCDNFRDTKSCEHIYASQLARSARRDFETEIKQEDETHLLCRYCGSPDLRKCGFRYNAHGISHRYYCYQCERKFSIRVIGSEISTSKFPQEVVMLLDHVGRLVSRLDELLAQLDSKLENLKTVKTVAVGKERV